jgi:hypothetical protein
LRAWTWPSLWALVLGLPWAAEVRMSWGYGLAPGLKATRFQCRFAAATAGSADVHFSSAIGSNTSANFASSTALGFGAQTTAANQMMFGTATNIYALPGVNSAASVLRRNPR